MWRIASGALAGCCVVLALPRLPSTSWLAAVLAATLFGGALLRSRATLALGAGAAWCAVALQAALADRLDPALEGRSLSVRGTVVSVPQGPLDGLRFRFAPEHGADLDGRRLPRTLELTWYEAPVRVLAAERLELEVKLRRPRGFANPGGRDNEARMLRDGVGAGGYVRFGRRLGRDERAWLRHGVLIARAGVDARVRAALGARPAAGIVAGLAVGLQDAVSREQWLTLTRSGTAHLMAISGLHIGMVAAIGAWLGARLQRARQRRGATGAQRDAAVVGGVAAALGYSLLAGWTVPTQRTLVMIGLAALALVLRRRVGIADGLAACALAVLAADPLAPLAPGFWLSFGAVAVILVGTTGHAVRPGWLRGYLRVQAVVTVGLVPVLVGTFGAVSLVAAFVNLYAIPLYTGVIVPAVLVACAVAAVSLPAGTVLLEWTGALIEWTWPLIEGPAQWPLATWSVAALGPAAWVALGVGVTAVLLPLPRAARVAGAALVLGACLQRPPGPAPGRAWATVLDVGQGLAVVVETHRHVLVYDTGPSFRSGSDTGQIVVAPFLRHRGLRGVDTLVVSHDDDDHAGGARSLLGLLPVRTLAAGPGVDTDALAAGRPALARRRCVRGEHWRWDGVEFEWLHPGRAPYARDNDGSCVLRVRASGHTLLLAGDVEARAEAELLAARAEALHALTVVIAPHHGSRTSSTAAFVETTRPAWVVYAVGHRNRWNFPVPEVVARYEDVGARALRTSTSGAIRFEFAPGPLAPPAQWRRERPRPWRDP